MYPNLSANRNFKICNISAITPESRPRDYNETLHHPKSYLTSVRRTRQQRCPQGSSCSRRGKDSPTFPYCAHQRWSSGFNDRYAGCRGGSNILDVLTSTVFVVKVQAACCTTCRSDPLTRRWRGVPPIALTDQHSGRKL
jgi:hypothetical protein